MSYAELLEHARYLRDSRKTAAYRAALAEVVRPGDRVLDLGAGTGLLGCLACEVGAGEVVAVDSGDILGLAREIAVANGYGDRIRHEQCLSTDLVLTDLVDVVVCDQIGGLVHEPGVLRYYADATRRLLVPGGVLVPSGFTISMCPVTYDEGRETVDFWGSRPAGLDVSAGVALAANSEWRCTLVPDAAVRLADPQVLAAFASDYDEPITGQAGFTVTTSGRLDGVLGWFTAQLSPSVTLTNDPWDPDRFDRWCTFYPLAPATKLVVGDRVVLQLRLLPRSSVVTWEVEVERAYGSGQRWQGSTFLGSFLTTRTLDRAAAKSSSRHDPARRALVLVATEALAAAGSQEEVVQVLRASAASASLSLSELEELVAGVMSLCR
jgi:protein arginine N-methyltransferase 1